MFEEDTKKPQIVKVLIYLLKKIFCILTIKQNKICILPYKKIKSKFSIKIITKIILKTTNRVVLSGYLNKQDIIKKAFIEKNIQIQKGEILKKYLLYNFIEYLSKSVNQEPHSQEVFILVNVPQTLDENIIIHLAQKFKRLNIVSKNIKHFKKLENYLEKDLGIAITITNNKRKSLLKAKIIINMDFNEEMLNSFNINPKAIIIQMNKQVYIQSKLFNGINILDYQITYKIETFDSSEYKKFDKKLLYESSIYGKRYETVIRIIEEDNIKIINLIGRNGIINKKEYDILS